MIRMYIFKEGLKVILLLPWRSQRKSYFITIQLFVMLFNLDKQSLIPGIVCFEITSVSFYVFYNNQITNTTTHTKHQSSSIPIPQK